jgi:hypothetical protein
MDTNVIGRMYQFGTPEPEVPNVGIISVHGTSQLTDVGPNLTGKAVATRPWMKPVGLNSSGRWPCVRLQVSLNRVTATRVVWASLTSPPRHSSSSWISRPLQAHNQTRSTTCLAGKFLEKCAVWQQSTNIITSNNLERGKLPVVSLFPSHIPAARYLTDVLCLYESRADKTSRDYCGM